MHTPGPWTIQKLFHAHDEIWLQIGWIENGREIGPIAEIVGGAVDGKPAFWHPVAELKHLIASEQEQFANARLIATAPEGLELARMVLDYNELGEVSLANLVQKAQQIVGEK